MAGGFVMLIAQVERYISLRQTLGFKLEDLSGNLSAFARFAADRGDNYVRVSTAVDWATEASSPHARYIRLRDVARLARFLHAEDPNHEVPTNSFYTSTRPFGRLRGASRTDGYSQHASRMSTRLLVQNL
jgi:hypothetical protein